MQYAIQYIRHINRKGHLLAGAAMTLLLAISSCKKDGAQLTLQSGTFGTGQANQLALNTNAITLAPTNDNDTVFVATWPSGTYGQSVIVSYSLQLDLPADTSGAKGWAHATSYVVGVNTNRLAFNGKTLNNLAISMGLPTGTNSALVLRVRADVTQYNGSASTVPPVYTNTVAFTVNPYLLQLFVPGSYQSWDPSQAPLIAGVNGKAGLFEGYVNITGAGTPSFKYTNARDWNHVNFGDAGNGKMTTDGLAPGMTVPTAGYYELTANLNDTTWTATKTTWSILGDASPGGWNTDTQMSYDAVNQVWTVTCNMIQAGSFKFRANNAWGIDFGLDANGNLAYADNPFIGYVLRNNLTVPSDGNYTIILDLHVPGQYTYQLIRN